MRITLSVEGSATPGAGVASGPEQGGGQMDRPCPRCRDANAEAARYCRRCGLVLVAAPGGFLGAGRVRHPSPLPPPDGFEPFENAPDLFARCDAAWGGRVLLGTETLAMTVFNGGYPLAQVTVRICGADEAGGAIFVLEREIADWPRGGRVRLEIPSYELPGPARAIRLALVSAEFGADR